MTFLKRKIGLRRSLAAEPQQRASGTDFETYRAEPMKFDTQYPADSVEFCTSPGYERIFVCGTYKLIKQTTAQTSADDFDDESQNAAVNTPPLRKRVGECILLKLREEDDDHAL